MAYNRGERPDSPMKRRGGRRRKKVCVFCGKENNEIDYKDVAKLRKYVSERGKILPRRMSIEEIFQTMRELVAEQFALEPEEVTMCKTSESTDSCC